MRSGRGTKGRTDWLLLAVKNLRNASLSMMNVSGNDLNMVCLPALRRDERMRPPLFDIILASEDINIRLLLTETAASLGERHRYRSKMLYRLPE